MTETTQPPHVFQTFARLENLAAIRRYVHESVMALGGAPAAADDMMQAVDECVTNIIVHGYQGQPGPIDLEWHYQDNRLTVYLRDRAPLFDPTSLPSPNLSLPLEERHPGGLGVYLARQMVDRMEYRVRPQGGNELILIKQLNSDTAHS